MTDASADLRGSRRHLATYPGERRADGAQRLLTTAQWDEDQVRADLLGYIRSTFGSHGTLYVTEMVFPKKGMHAAGVDRQYSVESARNENCQIGILLFYEAPDGSLLFIDRELYVPESWIRDPARCRRAAMPAGTPYRTKSAIAVELVNRAIAGGIVPSWTLVSLLCADKGTVQQAFQREGLPHLVTLTPGEFGALVRAGGTQVRTVSHETYNADPQRDGARGFPVRLRRVTLAANPMTGFEVSYLVDGMANRPSAGRLSGHYYAYAPREGGAGRLAETVATLRGLTANAWRSRDEIGIDRYEVRSWRGWYRHMTLAMLAQAALAMSKVEERGAVPVRPSRPVTVPVGSGIGA